MEKCKKVIWFEKCEFGFIWFLNLVGLIVIFKFVFLRLCGFVYWLCGRVMIWVFLVFWLVLLMFWMWIFDIVMLLNENCMWGVFDIWIVMLLNILLIVEVRY